MSRDFDFWVGDWEVTNQATGELAGHNLVELDVGGRVLVERYSTPGGFAGMSLNAYDAGSDRWHQCWMDSEGTVLDLYGGLVGGSMVLAGTSSPEGAPQLERITWTPNSDETVRQHWEQSLDAGESWVTAFDGLYRRRVLPTA